MFPFVVGQAIAGVEQADRDQKGSHALERFHALQTSLQGIVEQRHWSRCRTTNRLSMARRLRTDGFAQSLTVVQETLCWVPIGKRTSDNGVRVRQKRFSRCGVVLPYVAGFLTFAAPPAHRPYRSEDTGGGRERAPPCLDCLDRHPRGWACARSCYPPRGSLPSISVPAGRRAQR